MPKALTLTDTPEVTETRTSPRFNMLVTIEAQLDGQPALVRNLSERGLGLRHAAQIKVGSIVGVKVDAPENESATRFRCRVAWSRLSRYADERGRPYYDSGLQLVDDSTAAAMLMERLIRAYGVCDSDSLDAKRRVLEARAKLRAATLSAEAPPSNASRVTPEQLLLVREAQELLASDPERAACWHERAKESLVRLGMVSPDGRSSSHRRETLVIWEYLGRTLDLDVVSAIAGTRPER